MPRNVPVAFFIGIKNIVINGQKLQLLQTFLDNASQYCDVIVHCSWLALLCQKIQHFGEPLLTQSIVQVAAENVDLVDEFVYLGSLVSHDGGSEAEILRRITFARECFSLLNVFIYHSQPGECWSTRRSPPIRWWSQRGGDDTAMVLLWS